MTLPAGSHHLGPDNASLQVRTYREGVAAKAGHDLIIEVTSWEATVDPSGDPAIELSADPRSLHVREGLRGVKPLTDKDRNDIRGTIDAKVLGGSPISFRSRSVQPSGDGARLSVEGDLTMAGQTRPVTAELSVEPSGRIGGTIPVTQSQWGIKPYRGLMGALKVRDDVEIVVSADLPAG